MRANNDDDIYLSDIHLLCVKCQQPIKGRINTCNWVRVEWISPEGWCLKCYQEAKRAVEKDECCHFQD